MSLLVNQTSGFKKTTTFNFTTTNVESSTIDFGDGNFSEITNTKPVNHVYENYGIYTAHITDCQGVLGNQIKIIVEPHIEDSVDIVQAPTEVVVGKNTTKFVVDVCSNCPPPIRIKLDSIGSTTPFEHKLDNDWLKDVTPKKYFTSDSTMEENIITLTEDVVVTYNVGSEICGYKARFCFEYYDDESGDVEIVAELLRDCDLCYSELEYQP